MSTKKRVKKKEVPDEVVVSYDGPPHVINMREPDRALLGAWSSEQLVKEVLLRLGMPANSDDNFRDTPARWIKYLEEYTQGPQFTSTQVGTSFSAPATYHGMVIQSNIPFRGVCAHHLLPFFGKAHVGYVPNKRIIGLSKIARLVRGVGLAMPGLQENMTDEIADLLQQGLEAKGSICVISAMHTCMCARGVATPDVPTVTSSVRGVYLVVPAAREEFFAAVHARHLV